MSFDARKMSLDIPDGWSFTKISEIAGINESSISRDDFFDYIRYIDISSVSTDKMETPELMSLQDAPSRAKRILKEGDIIISTVRPNLKQFYLCNFKIDNHIVSTGFCVVSPKSNKYRWYLYSFLTSEIFTEYLIRVADGAAYPAFSYKEIRDAVIPLPGDEYLTFISNTSKSIFNKLQLNQQTNETLEAMAQAIFKSWFVDFDPVRAKIKAISAGRDPNRAAMAAITGISLDQAWDEVESALNRKLESMSDAQRTQLRQTAELFPDELVESEIGEVPKGWEYSTIGKEFYIVNGQSPPGSTYNEDDEGVPFYQGRTDFGFRFPTQRVYCTEPKRFAEKGDTLLSVRAPVGDLNIAIEDCCIGRGLASLRHKSGSISYTYYAMKQVQAQIEAYEATGTVFGSINQKQLKALDTIAPDKKVIDEFHRIADPIDSKVMNQVYMNRELSKLRDTLLPKLISGDIELNDKIKENLNE